MQQTHMQSVNKGSVADAFKAEATLLFHSHFWFNMCMKTGREANNLHDTHG